MDPPATRYLDRDGAALAYQVVGSGTADVVGYMSIVQHLDLCWTDPHIHYNYERLASFARGVYFQRRGLGLSESLRYVPSMEQQAEDILAVMDAVGMQRATILATVDTCAPAALVAALAPERVAGLVLLTPFAHGWYGDGELPVGWSAAEASDYLARTRAVTETWGSGATVGYWDPVLDTPFNRRLMALLERCSATPAAARAHLEAVLRYDMTDVLRAVPVPTRVLRIPSNRVPDAAVRHVAELIPNATYHLLPPTVRGASLGESFLPVIEHIEEMVTGHLHAADADRSLGTVLFTDVVDSTGLLSRLGDARYRELRAAHEREVRLTVEQAGGRLVKVSGDGTLSLFDSPSRAVRCADLIRSAGSDLGIAVRAGLHVGEVEHEGPDVAGLAVHIGARVAAAAGAGEVLATRTVHDLVAGSGLAFTPRGVRELRGVPGSWELFALGAAGQQRDTLPAEEPMQTSLDRAALTTARHAPRAARTLVRVGNAIQRRRVSER
jgi:class 3 adenylate cyclase/pimeloyl-ACP methyl ester carboxylesterase